jgi:alkylated DNA repair dioxygenase AlkB
VIDQDTSWVVPDPVVERIALGPDAWVDVVRGLVTEPDRVHDELAESVAWHQGKVFRYEKWIAEPRLSGGQSGRQCHPALGEVEKWLSRRYRAQFDGVALARYRDGRDSVAWHRDRELRWLEETVVGVLSLGAQRPFLLRPLNQPGRIKQQDPLGQTNGEETIDLRPASGDLLVMGGRCQAAWLHAVPKLSLRCRSRISAQWRWTSRRGRPDTNPSYYAPRRFNR